MNKNLSDREERAGNPERVNNMGQSPALCKVHVLVGNSENFSEVG